MKQFLSLFILAVTLFQLANANPSVRRESVLLIPGNSEEFMYELLEKNFDVRGMYGGYVFVFTTTFRALSLTSRFPDAINVEFPHSSTMFIIEGDSSTEGWDEMLALLDSDTLIQVLLKTNNLVFGGVPSSSLNIAFDLSPQIRLPRDVEFMTLPPQTIVPVKLPQDHPAHKKASFKASVAQLVAAMNESDLKYFVQYLSGEEPGSPFTTRHSYSNDAVLSGQWAISVFNTYGFNASIHSFPGAYCPNIVAEKRGTLYPNRYVIIGAHLDDRNRDLTDSSTRAPGGNDDGSGSAAILQIAKAIFDTKASFETTLLLQLYCGEEQGLYGSRAYARDAVIDDMDIVGMFQADMIAYQAYAQPQCAFVNRYTNTALTNYAKDIAALYVPEITRVDTTACCSDHQSFYEQGYPSVGFVEGGGYAIDPQYHTVTDTVNRDGFSFTQLLGITRAIGASGADLAGIF